MTKLCPWLLASNHDDDDCPECAKLRAAQEKTVSTNTLLDKLTTDLTAFSSFQDMLDAPNYRPTIYPRADDRRYEILADAYDAAQEARDDTRRAHRGHVVGSVARMTVRLNGVKHGSGLVSDWLAAIWEVNSQTPGTIGEPLVCYWGHGGWTEEYPRFRVVLLGDENTSGEQGEISAFDPAAAEMLRRACSGLLEKA